MNTSHRPPPLAFQPGVSIGPQVSPERVDSPQLAVNLGSNNPFRNRALSPSISTRPLARPERPTSTNPFLDDADLAQSAPGASAMSQPVAQQDLTGNARDLFENLSLNPPPQSSGYRPAPPRPDRPFQNNPPSGHAMPTRERSERRAKQDDPLDIFADPPSKAPSGSGGSERERRPHRRNSESSIMERTPKFLDPEDERRRKERRRREREARHRDGRSRSKKPHYQLDIIDKLDVTSIYGTGMFHHDGPFDACNPNRNRKGLRAAPMQAFPKNSTNMALGGAGPVNQNLDLNMVYGTSTEGYNDFASTGSVHTRGNEAPNFDPTKRIEPVHGSESMGLGTSTFLEGAPASRAAIRRESENDNQNVQNGGGLQRKKSLAQRIRGVNGNRTQSGRVISPDRVNTVRSESSHAGSVRGNDKNPFYQDYDDAWDKKGARIQVAEGTREIPDVGRVRSSSSPKQSTGLDRKYGTERSFSGLEDGKSNSGGFISRMKSLRKPRPERRHSDD